VKQNKYIYIIGYFLIFVSGFSKKIERMLIKLKFWAGKGVFGPGNNDCLDTLVKDFLTFSRYAYGIVVIELEAGGFSLTWGGFLFEVFCVALYYTINGCF